MTLLPNNLPLKGRKAVESLRRQWTSRLRIPFLPVLLGARHSCRSLWLKAAGQDHLFYIDFANGQSLLDQCVPIILSNVNLLQRSLIVLSQANGLSEDHLGRVVSELSQRQIISMFEQSRKPCSTNVAYVCSSCIHSRAQSFEDSTRFLQALRKESHQLITDEELLTALFELAGQEWTSPILIELFGASDVSSSPGSLHLVDSLRAVVSACIGCPNVRFGLSMTTAEYEFLLEEVQSPFLTSPLKENVFVVAEDDGKTIGPEEFSDGVPEESITGEAEALVQSKLQSVIPAANCSGRLVEKGVTVWRQLVFPVGDN